METRDIFKNKQEEFIMQSSIPTQYVPIISSLFGIFLLFRNGAPRGSQKEKKIDEKWSLWHNFTNVEMRCR